MSEPFGDMKWAAFMAHLDQLAAAERERMGAERYDAFQERLTNYMLYGTIDPAEVARAKARLAEYRAQFPIAIDAWFVEREPTDG